MKTSKAFMRYSKYYNESIDAIRLPFNLISLVSRVPYQIIERTSSKFTATLSRVLTFFGTSLDPLNYMATSCSFTGIT